MKTAWIVAANTALLYCILQLAAWAGLSIYDAVVVERSQRRLTEAERANYSHMSDRDRDEMLRVTNRIRFRYEPVVGFLLQETRSRFVNIGPSGIRSNGGAPREPQPLDGNVWFLGGSTTVGIGIADHETIPAQLERLIGRPVINLGVSNYATADENLLFAQHVRLGRRPSMAIFFDGINEACSSDLYAEEMRALVTRAQYEYAWDIGGPARWALQRAMRRTRRRVNQPPSARLALSCAHQGGTAPLAEIHSRRLAERRALCAAQDITCHTLVQPFAGLHGRREGFPQDFLNGDALNLSRLYHHLAPVWKADGSIFLTDVFDRYERHPFIDEVHYGADANRLLADAIAQRLALTSGR